MEEYDNKFYGADASPTSVRCNWCGHVFQIMQYRNFHIDTHPQWHEVLMKGDFFRLPCPNCQNPADISYPATYLDSHEKLGISLIPGLDSSEAEEELEAINKTAAPLIRPGMRRRVVGTFYAMQEQVLARELKLDDRVLQLLKPLIIGQQQSMGKEVWNGFFAGISCTGERENNAIYFSSRPGGQNTPEEEQAKRYLEELYQEPVYHFDIHMTNHQVERIGINETAYQLCSQILAQAGYEEDDGFFHIYDLNWAISIHNQRRA